jgi:uncharacterized membrane protein YqjE
VTVQQPDQSLGELFSRLSGDLSALMRDEVQLAKVELTESTKRAARAGGMLGAAAFAGYLAVVVLTFALAWGLAEVVPVGVAFLIVGILWLAIGAVLFVTGRERMRTADLKPEQTIETMQENVQWAKQQSS